MPAFLVMVMVFVVAFVLLGVLVSLTPRRGRQGAVHAHGGDSPMMFVDGGSSDCGPGDAGCDGGGGGGGGD